MNLLYLYEAEEENKPHNLTPRLPVVDYVLRFAEEVMRDETKVAVCYLVIFLDLCVPFQIFRD